nr:hypothetical protein [Tanacetum cinerariifolium]
MPPPTTKGKRIKTSAKAVKPAKNKQLAKTSNAKGEDEGTGGIPEVLNVPTYESNDEQISWKSREEDDDEEVNMNNDGDDFVHPKFSTHDDEDKEEESFDTRVQTPSHVETTDDEDNDEDSQGMNVKGNKLDEEEENKEDEGYELYRDMNINLEGRDIQMADAQQTNVLTTQVTEDTYVIITSVNPEGQQQSSSVSSRFVSNIFNPSLDTALEDNFLEFIQTNQFAEAISLILGIVDKYLDNQMNDAVKVAVQLQSDKLRDEAKSENEDFLNKLDENIKKITKEQVKEQVKAQVSKILPKIKKTINEQIENEVLTRSSSESKTSHDIAANLSELKLKKILIDKMERNKSICRYDEDEEPSARSNRGSKRRKAGKEPESTSAPKKKTFMSIRKSTEGSKSHHKSASKSALVDEPLHTAKDLEEPTHQEFIIAKPPTPDRDWYKTLPAQHVPVQLWISNLAQKDNSRDSFNELMDTSLDFSAFMMNRLKVDILTPELLTGLTFQLMQGSCKSLVELEYFFKEVYKATTDQLDWNNPEGQQYPYDLQKPIPLIPNSQGHRVIPFDHFINNDLEYLSGGVSSRKYTTSVTKTKVAVYGNIK